MGHGRDARVTLVRPSLSVALAVLGVNATGGVTRSAGAAIVTNPHRLVVGRRRGEPDVSPASLAQYQPKPPDDSPEREAQRSARKAARSAATRLRARRGRR